MHDTNFEAAELVRVLRRLRETHGNPTLAAISRRTGERVSAATLSRLFAGRNLPSMHAVYVTARALTRDTAELYAVRELYNRATQEQYRRRVRPDRRAPAVGTSKKDPGLQQLQDDLEALALSAGLSVRQIAARTGIPKSTVGDALHYDRLPRPDVVAAIAGACGGDADAWRRSAEDLVRAKEEAAKSGREHAAPSPSEVLIDAAVTRSPAEIAALATNLKGKGQTALATLLVETAVKERAVEDVTALAVALLGSGAEAEREHGVEVPEQKQEPPSSWRRWRGKAR
ncbi:helix-turn-helix transcriptional regulator [Streptomyces sp. NPDC087538]|uniref:helix-turn-helix transcriptional regulator n=1 Tax=Streptomyces sp. NPDC087538 TaxID=3365797 RepID=UPI0038275D26